jgi:aryl-alcohol dehydrogenase-like predicted oxidoreductase
MLVKNSCRRVVIASFGILSLSSWFHQHRGERFIIDGIPHASLFASALSTAPTSIKSKRIELGTLSVSPMGFGTLNLPLDKTEGDENTVQVVKAAHAAGINLIDTAEAYGFGRSESLTKWAVEQAGLKVGQTASSPSENEMAIATKFAPVPWRPGADSVIDACRASNDRLGVEACDLYQSE